MTTRRLSAMVFCGAVVTGLIALALINSRGTAAESPTPLPLGAPESTWTTSNGIPILALIPDRVAVSTIDGGTLRQPDGSPVTAPFGDEMRGTISSAEADRQRQAVQRAQLSDACDRGVKVPVGAGGSGATLEESQRNAAANLAKALASNGGKSYRDACDAL